MKPYRPCLGAVGVALQHKLCHTLGGTFDLPHAETHAIVLPHAVAYNSTDAPDAMARIAHALGTKDAASGLFALTRALAGASGHRDARERHRSRRRSGVTESLSQSEADRA
jgi:maleylacetate reductase